VNILITGRPGVGKTTVIRRVLEGLDGRPGGFTTQEIRRGGRRVGFSIRAVDTGQEGILAHIDLAGPHRVGPYGVDTGDVERIGVPALIRAMEEADVIVMDEIGRMENYCSSFRSAVLRALDAPRDVLGTLQMRSTPFLDRIRQRDDVTIRTLTPRNRDDMPRILLELFHTGDHQAEPEG
jgi:nucleoside-triphosphatase